ncbi:hypothetical protein E0H22_02660 [Rhodopseudomonas boonkerdii]|uniref:hypothetical protein n=1 Tax=Rhodopseudomonas boonkerdii TaxID=475937 RepID=UPI001E3C3D6E|nr:hypothetical protein [Rhodopseudomonas boonkerdii]UGV24681.1 hypothetical protein E0H22_02660 [Rhodopseudomonas boonkerdii]
MAELVDAGPPSRLIQRVGVLILLMTAAETLSEPPQQLPAELVRFAVSVGQSVGTLALGPGHTGVGRRRPYGPRRRLSNLANESFEIEYAIFQGFENNPVLEFRILEE